MTNCWNNRPSKSTNSYLRTFDLAHFKCLSMLFPQSHRSLKAVCFYQHNLMDDLMRLVASFRPIINESWPQNTRWGSDQKRGHINRIFSVWKAFVVSLFFKLNAIQSAWKFKVWIIISQYVIKYVWQGKQSANLHPFNSKSWHKKSGERNVLCFIVVYVVDVFFTILSFFYIILFIF